MRSESKRIDMDTVVRIDGKGLTSKLIANIPFNVSILFNDRRKGCRF